MTQTCLQVVADMYQAKVHTLEINVEGGRMRKGATEIEREGARVQARWTELIPNPHIKDQGEFRDQVKDFFLFNSSMTHYDLLVHRESKLAEQGLVIKSKDTKSKEKQINQNVVEKSVKASQTNDSDTEDEDEHIHCLRGCPISKANTLEEEYWELKLAHEKLNEKYNNEKKEKEEEDKKMKGKVTAAKFRAEIRLLKASYSSAMETVAEETTKKEEALTMLKLLKATEKVKKDINMIEQRPTVEEIAEEPELEWTDVCRSKEKSSPPKTNVKCKNCDETFSTEKRLKKHAMKHSVRGEAQTKTNDKPHSDWSDNKSAETVESPEKKKVYHCDKCENICPSENVLKRHIHTRHEPIVCYLCDEDISSRYDLMKHKEVVHKITKLMTCKFFLENDCLYSHKNSDEPKNMEAFNNNKTHKTQRQIVCKKGKKCDRKCDFTENAHMHISDVFCHFQEKCTKERCPFKHNKAKESFFKGGNKNNKKVY